jgi:hypothetical protein
MLMGPADTGTLLPLLLLLLPFCHSLTLDRSCKASWT